MILDLEAPAWATHLVSDLGDWRREPLPVSRLGPLTLPDDVYFEYAWMDDKGVHREDPRNSNPRLNPWLPHACHVTGPLYATDEAVAMAPKRTAGRTLRLAFDSRILHQKRRLLVYSPAGCSEARLPFILFQDGLAYFKWGRAAQVMDWLLGTGKIQPAHLVFVPPVQRTREYAFNPDYRRFLGEEMIPNVAERVPWNGRATAWGASLGGLLSAELAWERPDIFQKVVAQSGAFQFSAEMDFTWPFGGTEKFLRQVKIQPDPLPTVRWHLECGTLEWLEASNHHLERELVRRGQAVDLVLRPAGHNWVQWRNGLAAGMLFAVGT